VARTDEDGFAVKNIDVASIHGLLAWNCLGAAVLSTEVDVR
jgi:hypothetical protein